jgi:hypothetical protein
MLKHRFAAAIAVAAVSLPLTLAGAQAAHALACEDLCPIGVTGGGGDGEPDPSYSAEYSDEYMPPAIPPSDPALPPSKPSSKYSRVYYSDPLQWSFYNDPSGDATIQKYNGYDAQLGTTTPTEAIYAATGPGAYHQNGINLNFTVPTASQMVGSALLTDGFVPTGAMDVYLQWDMTTITTDAYGNPVAGNGGDNVYVSIVDDTTGLFYSEVWATNQNQGNTRLALDLTQFRGHQISVSFEGMFGQDQGDITEFDIANTSLKGDAIVQNPS